MSFILSYWTRPHTPRRKTSCFLRGPFHSINFILHSSIHSVDNIDSLETHKKLSFVVSTLENDHNWTSRRPQLEPPQLTDVNDEKKRWLGREALEVFLLSRDSNSEKGFLLLWRFRHQFEFLLNTFFANHLLLLGSARVLAFSWSRRLLVHFLSANRSWNARRRVLH